MEKLSAFALLMHDSHCCLVVVLDDVVDVLWLCTGVLDWMGLFGGMGVGETLERFRSTWHLARSTPTPTGFWISKVFSIDLHLKFFR